MRYRFILSVFIVVLVALAGSAGPALADDVAALKAKLSALDKTRLGGAKEKALLGEIGGLAKGLKARATPEAFHRRMARGRAHVKSAKNRADFRSAAKEFRAAVMAAPWVASAHYNLGIVRDKAGLYNGAIRSLRTYLALKPGASDARRVRNLTYEIEVRREKATQARRTAKTRKAKPRKPPAPKQKTFDLTGTWQSAKGKSGKLNVHRYQVRTVGNSIEIDETRWQHPNGSWNKIHDSYGGKRYRGTINGRNIRGTVTLAWTFYVNGGVYRRPFTGTVGPKGTAITISHSTPAPGFTGPTPGFPAKDTVHNWRVVQVTRTLRKVR